MKSRAIVLRAPLTAFLMIAAWAFCDDPTGPEDFPSPPVAPAPLLNVGSGSATLVAAGDIARCGATRLQDEATADLIDAIPSAVVVTLGDNVFVPTTREVIATDYDCYTPSWGRTGIVTRTHASAGDRDWSTTEGKDYFDYFIGRGAQTGDRGKGYYSFEVGDWHVIALNSGIAMDAASPQYQWLKDDLASSSKECTLAYWHRPLFYSSGSMTRPSIKPLWDLLYSAGADVVLNSDERFYERFRPMTPAGDADDAYGIREFIVGTGGISNQAPGAPRTNSQRIVSNVFGILVLTLHADGYDWEFRPIAGQSVTPAESGSATCHTSPLPTARPGGPYRSEATVQFDGRKSFDPQGDTPLTYSWDFGDGTTHSGSDPKDATPEHTYAVADDRATAQYTVSLTITDANGEEGEPATTTATIANIAPAVSAGPDLWANPGASVTVRAYFSDPGTNDGAWAYTIHWGDGSDPAHGTTPTADNPVIASHAYSTAATYPVIVTVTDKDGGLGSDRLDVTVSDLAAPAQIFTGAGDIAECTPSQGDERTANLLDNIPGSVFTVGDNVYPEGTAEEYQNCYEPSWGRHKARTFAAIGNHEYHTPGAGPTFDYFGSRIGPRGKAYYSFDLGAWHVIVLNSIDGEVPYAVGSPQHDWLKGDLAGSNSRCTIAIFHNPRFWSTTTPGLKGASNKIKVIWDELYAAGVELVLNGNNHHYERFRPLTPAGEPDDDRGIRQFIVGTGGAGGPGPTEIWETSEAHSNSLGVLKLTLEPDKYSWEFLVAAGEAAFTDQGSGTCHDPEGAGPQAVSVGVSSSSHPTVYGEDVTFTATVTSASAPVTEGSVSFFDGGTCEVPGASFGSAQTPDATGKASVTSSSLSAAASPHTVIACYDGTQQYSDGLGSLTHIVDRAPQSIAFGELQGKKYGDPDFGVSASASSGLAVQFGGSGDCAVSGSTVSLVRAGSCTVTASQAGDGNYLAAADVARAFAIAKGQITISADDKSRMYGDPNPTLTGSLTGVNPSDNITATYTTAAGPASVVGDYPIEPALSDPDAKLPNYDVQATAGVLTITRAPLSAKADNKARPYGDDNPPLTGSLDGVRNSDDITLEFITDATTSSAPGDYAIIPTLKDPTNKLPNYDVSTTDGVLSVGKAAQSITFGSLPDKAYGDADFTVSATATSNLAVAFAASGGCSMAGTIVKILSAMSCSITASQPGDANYGPADDVTQTFAVAKASLSVTANDQEREYGALNPALTGVLEGVRNDDNITATYATTATPESPVGDYGITPTLLDPDGRLVNYEPSVVNGTLRVGRASQSIAFDALTNKIYGDAPVALSASATSGIAVSFSVTGACRLVGTSVTIAAAGNCTVTASQPGNENHQAAVDVAQSFAIAKAALTVRADNKSRGFGEQNPPLTGTLEGVRNGDAIVDSYSTDATAESPAGEYDIIASVSAPDGVFDNYDVTRVNGKLTIGKASQTITLAELSDKRYGDPPFAVSATASSDLTVALAVSGSCTVDGSTVTIGAVGSCTVTASQSGNESYGPAADVVRSFLINRAALIVTAENKSRAYGEANPPLTGTVIGLVDGDDVTATYTTAAVPTSPVGEYDIEPSVTSSDGELDNYDVELIKGKLTVGKAAQSIIFDELPPKTYGDAAFAPTAQANSGLAVTFAATGNCSLSGGFVSMTAAGSCTITASQVGNEQYAAAADVARAFAIAKAALTVRADDKSRAFGEENPALTGTLEGMRNGDQIADSYTTSATSESPAGEYDIIASVTAAAGVLDNYTVTSIAGKLTVGRANQTINFAQPADKTYGDADSPLDASTNSALPVSFSVSGDCTLSGATAQITGVGSCEVTASQTGNESYAPAADVVRSFVIKKATLTVTADDKSRPYGEPNPALTGTVAGVVNGDDLTASYATVATPTSPVGEYDIEPSITSSNGELENYDVTLIKGKLTVGKAAQSITFDELSPKTYGDAAFPLSASASSGLAVAFVATGDCSLSGGSVTIFGAGSCTVTASQPGNENYGAAADVARTFAISKAALTVRADDKFRAYGEENPALTGSLEGVRNGDQIVASYSTNATSGSPAGEYDIVASVTAAPGVLDNYDVTSVSGKLTVSGANQTISFAQPADKTYGDAGLVPAATASSSLPVAFAAAGNCSIGPNGAVELGDAGSCAITASQTGNLNYLAAADVTQSFSINKAPLTVTADDKSRGHGEQNPPLTGTLEGVLKGDRISALYSTDATTASAVGEYDILATLDDPDGRLANYDVTSIGAKLRIGKAGQSITFAQLSSKTYGDTDVPLDASASSALSVSFSVSGNCALSGSSVEITGAGSCEVTASQAGNENYNAAESVVRSFGIGRAGLSVTADDKSRPYGQPNPLFSGGLSGLVNGDNITANYSTDATVTSPIGTYAIVATLSDPGGRLGNYAVEYRNGILTVGKATQSIDFGQLENRTYGEPAFALTATATSGLPVSFQATGGCSVSGAMAHIEAAQSCSITASQNGDANHQPATDVVRTFNTAKAQLTATADDKSRSYGEANPGLTGTLIGVKNGDALSPTFSTGATAESPAGAYVITAAVADPTQKLSNYNVSYVDGALIIGKAALSVRAHDQTRIYGDANPALTGTLEGVQNNDNITASFATAAVASSPVGMYAIGPTLNDPGNKLGNYEVTSTDGTLSVTKAALSVTADNKSRPFGDPNPALTGTLTGIKNGDNISASYSTTATSGSPAGDYPITSSLNDPDGKLSNYTVNSTQGILTVTTKKDQTIAFNALPEKKFNAPNFEISAEASSGLLITFSTTSDRCTVGSSTLSGTVSTATVKLKDVGIGASGCAITARQGGNANHEAASDETRSFDVLNNIDAIPGPPGMNPNNSLSKSSSQNREFEVAILTLKNADGTVIFDATRVNPSTVTVTGPTGKAVKVAVDSKGALKAYMRDTDGDFDQDLIMSFPRDEVFNSSHVNATHPIVLNGNLKPDKPDGRPILGRDTIKLNP